jgi:hypothetical protein
MPSAPPRWLYRRRHHHRGATGDHMSATPDHTPSPLSTDDWLNVVWVTTRVMIIVGYPPLIISRDDNGAPGIMWANPETEQVLVVLDYEDNADEEPNMTMHISEQLSEGTTMALVGLCAMRDVQWDLISDAVDDDESKESEQKDSKSNS